MNLALRPEIEQRIAEQVRLGRFPTPEAVVEAAVVELTETNLDESLDEADIAAINEAEAQIDRGEGIDLATLRADMLYDGDHRLARRPLSNSEGSGQRFWVDGGTALSIELISVPGHALALGGDVLLDVPVANVDQGRGERSLLWQRIGKSQIAWVANS